MVRQIPTVMTIAGSDPSGGAGIQSDLKTFAAHGVTGTSVIASLTVQSSQGVRECHDIPPEVVASQITALWEDGRPAAIKTGMLGNAAIVETVARILKRRRA
ncbi:MAG: hydroxymethylpyrimidine/phosphomethylpyrimidine kinase, partial [Nitrospinaceae bacterium]